MTTTSQFDLETLRRGLEGRDAGALASLYAEDAEFVEVDKDHPPTNPRMLRGRRAIAEHLEDVCARDMTHKLERPVVSEDRLAYSEDCRYEDGTNVRCIAIADLNDEGRIVRQLGVTAWDA
jgi:hypothetical protein